MLTIAIFLLVVALIILATVKFKLHPFFALICAALIVGLSSGMNAKAVLDAVAQGFGGTLKSIGIVIAFGTIIGYILEKTGGASQMAKTMIKLVGEKKSPLAMSLTGLIVSMPVFCDSGFIILSPLNRALSARTGRSLAVLAVALATGLYATHVFVPPTPGPLAAAANVGADIGLVLIFGLIVSIPAAGAGLLWATRYARKFNISIDPEKDDKETFEQPTPGTTKSLLPILVPIILIALRSVADYPTTPFGLGMVKEFLDFIGHPIVALLLGVIFALMLVPKLNQEILSDWLGEGLKNAGVIILITGAGGAFGAVLKATSIGDLLGSTMAQWRLGIFLPFLIAAALKTAQGSSTVALITTSAILAPLLTHMGLDTPIARALVVLAIGAGSMTVSHANDSYFWVVSQFSNMDVPTALRCHTLATLVEGLAAMITIAILSFILI